MRSRSNGRGYPPNSAALPISDDISLISTSTAGLGRQESLLSNQKAYRSAKSPGRSSRMAVKLQSLAIPKAGRVRVGIRCRPAFQEEIDFAQGEFFSIIDCIPSAAMTVESQDDESSSYDHVALTLLSGKQRDFAFDFTFGPLANQDEVYDRIARPVVQDVLRGFNGTIFCYGQTGTGKTYTMGILEFVSDEHAGIIPRSIAQIFDYIRANPEVDSSVSMSFLQIYRETIQDLLGPITGATNNNMEDNLAIREDPQRGFYVEGLQEFAVSNYAEAEALINVGLENRAMAPTLMNTTSSRSHTILTIVIEQRGVSSDDRAVYGTKYSRTIRSKLLMVDLAGSERVRRTVSKGTRLSEAKSINTSLSALGNVIAALADHNVSHIPYRDSKLTRLLQDSLGGSASTALIATVGPAPVNYGETLSTLVFASRCMAVKTTPIQHEEVDYAEMCARLQERVGNMEGEMNRKLQEQQDQYELVIQSLRQELVTAKEEFDLGSQQVNITSLPSSSSLEELNILLQAISPSIIHGDTSSDFTAWVNSLISTNDSRIIRHTINNLSGMLAYCYEIITSMSIDTQSLLKLNLSQEIDRQQKHDHKIKDAVDMERLRELETRAMEEHDPFLRNADFFSSDKVTIGSHLAPLSYVESRAKVQSRYPSNNDTHMMTSLSKISFIEVQKEDFSEFTSWEELATNLVTQHDQIRHGLNMMLSILQVKDSGYDNIKEELIEQLVERRKREEEVVNWSYILKYLLNTSSKLKKQLQHDKRSNLLSSPTFEPNSSPSSPPSISSNKFLTSAPIISQPMATIPSASSTIASKLFNHATEAKPPSNSNSINVNPFNRTAEIKYNPISHIQNTMMHPPAPPSAPPPTSSTPMIRPIHTQPAPNTIINQLKAPSLPPPPPPSYLPEDHISRRFATPKTYQDPSYPTPWASSRFDPSALRPNDMMETDDDMIGDNHSAIGSDIAPSNLSTTSFRSAATVQSIPMKVVSKPPSMLAQSIVQDLGVEGPSAAAAMQVIDRVSQLTPQQLEQLDTTTRAQIMQIRKDLGIDAKLNEPSSSIVKRSNSFNINSSRYPPSHSRSYDSMTSYPIDADYNHTSVSSEGDRARLMMEAKRYQRNMNTPGTTAPSSYQPKASTPSNRPSSATRSSRSYRDIDNDHEYYPPQLSRSSSRSRSRR